MRRINVEKMLMVILSGVMITAGAVVYASDCYLHLGTPQDLTTSYADVGKEFRVSGADKVDVQVCYDKNDGASPKIKVLLKTDVQGAQYGAAQALGSVTTANTPVPFADLAFAPVTDADGCWWLPINTRQASFMKMQAVMATAGATPAQIDSVEICK